MSRHAVEDRPGPEIMVARPSGKALPRQVEILPTCGSHLAAVNFGLIHFDMFSKYAPHDSITKGPPFERNVENSFVTRAG